MCVEAASLSIHSSNDDDDDKATGSTSRLNFRESVTVKLSFLRLTGSPCSSTIQIRM